MRDRHKLQRRGSQLGIWLAELTSVGSAVSGSGRRNGRLHFVSRDPLIREPQPDRIGKKSTGLLEVMSTCRFSFVAVPLAPNITHDRKGCALDLLL